MTKSEARWFAVVLVSMVSAPLLGCGGERSVVAETRPAASEAAPAPVAKAVVRNDVTVFSDGSSKIGPRINDVAMLKLLPDGTYARTCGPPDPETRTMMEGVMRARMGSRR